MNKDIELLRQIEELREPRHLFILPAWVNPEALDRLIESGYLTFSHLQRANGVINVVMGLRLTHKGNRMINPRLDWLKLAMKGSLAGASFMAVSLAILYLG